MWRSRYRRALSWRKVAKLCQIDIVNPVWYYFSMDDSKLIDDTEVVHIKVFSQYWSYQAFRSCLWNPMIDCFSSYLLNETKIHAVGPGKAFPFIAQEVEDTIFWGKREGHSLNPMIDYFSSYLLNETRIHAVGPWKDCPFIAQEIEDVIFCGKRDGHSLLSF